MMLLFDRAAAVAEVGDDLVFGLQQGVCARLQDACGLLKVIRRVDGAIGSRLFSAASSRCGSAGVGTGAFSRGRPEDSRYPRALRNALALLWSSRRDLSAVGLDRE